MTNDATLQQIRAADPRFSTWLSANAGSGKTRVLTDRVARLLLAGTEPQNILCLTYTKAAAGEMQNRLFKRLGEWAMLADGDLLKALGELGEAPPDDQLSRARTLFARAIEAPGGLKIQTIHSFCSSVLRQFPLEARVSPQFREIDEFGQKALIEAVLDNLATQGHPALASVSRIFSGESLSALARAIARNRTRFDPPYSKSRIRRFFGVPENQTLDDILGLTLQAGDVGFLKDTSVLMAAHGSPNDVKLAARLALLPDRPDLTALEICEDCLLTGLGANEPFSSKAGSIPTKAFRTGPFQPYAQRFADICDRVEVARRSRIALEAADKTHALHEFAQAFLPAYAAAKETAGALDFDDLIQKAGSLLTTRSLEWVLYRLDGGIEHILVDEAQDTSPTQWNVIRSLANEITSGKGAREDRTIFVVGDPKQSIYSFQGADAREFGRMKEHFTERLRDGPALVPHELHFSFRSSAAILGLVDTTFASDAGRGLGQESAHRAYHETLPGRVDLWPLEPSPDADMTPEWYDPVDTLAANNPKVELAKKIAEEISALIKTGTIPGENGHPRRIRAGDFLILVQGRGELFDQIIRACKAERLPMAGADRLKIAGELAVKDLLALLSFLALQEDSLSLAAVLRSPLFGWTEKQLFDLAQGRRQDHLWAELRDRKAEFPETFKALSDLLRQVDFLRPYELLESILTRHEGRKKLLARLGPEAEDGIDELLNQALAFERDVVPSLTVFLTRAQSEDVEIKRSSDASGGLIRVMTVHGAKGLEAPIVILPDTTRYESPQRDPLLLTEAGMPVWRVSGSNCPEALENDLNAEAQADREERHRLLYVAMTRAEKWLIVCGAETGNNRKGSNWYTDVAEGFARIGTLPIETRCGEGQRASHGEWPAFAEIVPVTVTIQEKLPGFLKLPASPPIGSGAILAPSDLGGEKTVGEGAKAEEAALRHGRQVHRLLELLPDAGLTRDAAARLLASGPDPADEGEIDALADEALNVIRGFPDLFASDALAEVDASALLPSLGYRISGVIDRLLVDDKKVVVADFKTNAVIPRSAEEVPEGILRQMGAYLECLEQIYPGHEIDLRVIWTKDATQTVLPHGIVREALTRTQHLDVPSSSS